MAEEFAQEEREAAGHYDKQRLPGKLGREKEVSI